MWNMQLSKEKKYWLLIGKTWFGMGQSWYRERRLRTWEPLRLTAARLNMKFCFAADGKRSCFARPQNCARAGGEHYQLKFSRTKVYYRIKLIMHTEKSVYESLPHWIAARFNMEFCFAAKLHSCRRVALLIWFTSELCVSLSVITTNLGKSNL